MNTPITEQRALIERLRKRYTPETVPPCPVCNSPLTVQAAGGGSITWGCVKRDDGASPLDDHYDRSRWEQLRTGDSDVLDLIAAFSRPTSPVPGETGAMVEKRETPFERSRYLKHVPPVEGDLSTRRHWIIVHEPGKIPEKKGAFGWQQVEDFLRELIACRPEGTTYTVISLTWDFDIWIESGHDYLVASEVIAEVDEHDSALDIWGGPGRG